MGLQFERITHSPTSSLTLIVDDIARERRELVAATPQAPGDMAAWLNALQVQSTPLVASKAGRADLAAWLEAVEKSATPAPLLSSR